MQVRFIDSITAVSQEHWNSVTGCDYPFTRHEFLHALEVSGATCKKTGWQPHHALIYHESSTGQRELQAVVPLYLKYHSYGEYVFDWSWADAYRQHGLQYYPKLLSAIPYTPATGQRLCFKSTADVEQVEKHFIEAIYQQAKQLEASSIHILFPTMENSLRMQHYGLRQRKSVQYHWFNNGFKSFGDFLATFNSRKRKNLKKERREIDKQGLTLKVLEGIDITPDIWQTFYNFYQLTYAKRSGHGGYLGQQFFQLIGETLTEHIVLVLAYNGEQPIAGALNFKDNNTLYGRYWGCTQEFDYLHFEACYYQGIEYCIANNLQRFDPGAQGEHKIQRGFIPTPTWSNHWIAHPAFSAAVDEFLKRDNAAMESYIKQANSLLPFKQS